MLVYSNDQSPGIRRKGAGKGFYYLDSKGVKVTDSATLERIRSLAIPPAYTDVWICDLPNGHLQATGRDRRKRKQYRYHPEWHELRNLDKFDRLLEIGEALPRLRRRLREDLKEEGSSKKSVVAAAVRIIDRLGLRVGNERYLKENRTRGISTLADHNVDATESGRLEIIYTAKGGKTIATSLHDPLAAAVIDNCHELGGQRLFTYRDVLGEVQSIDSADINRYLADTCECAISAKDLRTWRASTLAVDYLRSIKQPEDREAEIRGAVQHAADAIHNRYATCRKHYIHPKVLDVYRESKSSGLSRRHIAPRAELQQAESLLLKILAKK